MTYIKHPALSFSLVALQFTLIGLLLLVLPLSLSPIVLTIQAFAILLGLWAVKTMHLGHFNIVPDPLPETEVVANGPYSFIRHPMYLSILLFFIPLVILYISWLAIGLYSVLAIVLLLKIRYEEQLLVEALPEYEEYRQNSKKLIPFLF